jgi:alpha-galactosidase
MDIISEFSRNTISASYVKCGGAAGLCIVPQGMESAVVENRRRQAEPLVQLHIEGDDFPDGFANGHTLRFGGTMRGLEFISQRVDESDGAVVVVTVLGQAGRYEVENYVSFTDGDEAFETWNIFKNTSGETMTLDMLSSFAFGGITPFEPGNAPDTMVLHRARSCWSAEGRIESTPVEDIQLEPSWSSYGVRVERFGQLGSMPVRKYFPFVAVEDIKHNVTWAAQLACNGSWQIEAARRGDGLGLSGGLPDFDFGHWKKNIAPGESFETPKAIVTVAQGGVDEACAKLLTVARRYFERVDAFDTLPVLFNEYCTTWGCPSHENIKKTIDALKGRDIDDFVIDAGWYADEHGWSGSGGDWIVSPALFPDGIDKTVAMIKEAGFGAGIWFEAETCAPASKIFKREDMLLKRDGRVISTGGRRFLDLRKPEVMDYLDERVIQFIKQHGFNYIKIDYNDTIGVGCDGAESLGEGLRQNMEGSKEFFRRLRAENPGLVIENCSSGGHRLEPSMMALCSMASFSDAHECVQIPLIAANLHRLILPAQSQIWAVIRASDSIKRINYSLVNTFLGVMCLSGDVAGLDAEQWAAVDRGIAFYRSAAPVIKDGVSKIYGTRQTAYGHPKGWQGVVRRGTATPETLVVFHTFEGRPDAALMTVGGGMRIKSVLSSEGDAVTLEGDTLRIEPKADFEAVAVLLAKE